MSFNARDDKLSPHPKCAASASGGSGGGGGSGKRLPAIARRISRGFALDTSSFGQNKDGDHHHHHHHHHQDCIKLILEINAGVAVFRDMLINIGQTKDCPELREKVRKVRRQCVDICKTTNQILLPQVRRDVAEGIPVDNQDLVHLFCLSQLLIRELKKCKRLIVAVPMDMTEYMLNRPGPSGMSVLGQIIFCSLAPDFTQEEMTNIERDMAEVNHIIAEMQEFLPKEGNGKNQAFQEETFIRWQRKRRKHASKWQKLLKANCK